MVRGQRYLILSRVLAPLCLLLLIANPVISAQPRGDAFDSILHQLAGDDLKSFFGFTPEIKVIQSAAPNAFAIWPNQILLTSGLLDLGQNRPQISFVIAHELSHLMLKHHPHQASTLLPSNAISAIASELDADKLAIALLNKAAISTRGVVDFLKSLKTYNQRTPSSLSVRIAALSQ